MIVFQPMVDILFIKYLLLVLQKLNLIIKLELVVIIRNLCYLIEEKPYLEPLYIGVIINYQTLLS